LQRIERNVVLADSVITTLSNFAKMPLPNLQPFALEQCLREALEINPPGDHIAVTLDCPAGLPAVLGDIDQLRIVLGNLVRNAREAMPQGGQLTLRARPEGDAVALEIIDTGVGIPAENLPRIMEPLYSTKARGLGLGLAMARAILDKNRCHLRIASEVGRGSIFTVLLPLAAASN
jgi:signal transduction histidine kinase